MKHKIQKLFLGAGAMKAGTTWLYSILSQHPEIYFTPEKEVHFLSDYYLGTNALRAPQRLSRAINYVDSNLPLLDDKETRQHFKWWLHYCSSQPDDFDYYRGLFRFKPDDAWCSDFSNLTCHLKTEHWQDLQSKVEDLRVIYILRNPIERLWSHIKFHQKFVSGSTDFGEWTEDGFRQYITQNHIWQNSKYSENLLNLQSSIPDHQLYIGFIDDFQSNPNYEIAKVLDFLDVGDFLFDNSMLQARVNTTETIKMPEAFLNVALDPLKEEMDELLKVYPDIPDNWHESFNFHG